MFFEEKDFWKDKTFKKLEKEINPFKQAGKKN